MKALTVILCLTGMLLAVPAHAKFGNGIHKGEVFIGLAKDNKLKPKWDVEDYSLTCLPTVTHDGESLYIYSDVLLEECGVTVKDSQGNVVESAIATILPGQCFRLVPGVEGGTYRVELECGGDCYYGHFEM